MIGVYDYTVIATYASLFVGLCGIFASMEGQPFFAVIALMITGILDAFDGRIARTKKNRTNVEKRFGIQIDSLADMTSFGVLPACIGYAVGLQKPWQMVLLIGYALAGLIRLAYFNVMEEVRQSKDGGKRQYYDGLPITNAALLLSLTFFICRELFPQAMIPAYGTMMAITGVCFVSPIKVKKPSLIGNMAIAFTGLGILFAVFKISGRI